MFNNQLSGGKQTTEQVKACFVVIPISGVRAGSHCSSAGLAKFLGAGSGLRASSLPLPLLRPDSTVPSTLSLPDTRTRAHSSVGVTCPSVYLFGAMEGYSLSLF